RGEDGQGTGRSMVRLLDQAKGLPLGIDPEAPFNEDRLILDPGQMVVLYTDGVTEAKDSAGEFLGIEGVERAMSQCGAGAGEAVRCLTNAVQAHLGPEKANDDQTILVLEAL